MEEADYKKRAEILERRMREYRRNIAGISTTQAEANFEQVDFFEARYDSAVLYMEKFLEAYSEREELSLEAEKRDFPNENWISVYDTLQHEMIKADGRLRTLRRALSQKSDALPPPDPNATLNLTASLSRSRLPEIPIPSFQGDLLQWTSFRDTFVSLIHEDTSLTNVQKFHYLIGALKGEASSLVTNFPVDDASYEQAWAKVKKTYDNPRVLASLLVQRILDCDTSSCRSELQRYEVFLTNIADSVEAFKALNLDAPEEFLLASLALRALDPATRRHFELSLGSTSDFPTVDKVIDFVRQRRLALKMSQDLGVKNSSAHKSFSKRNSGLSFHLADSSGGNYSNQPSSRKSSSPQLTRKQQQDTSTPRSSNPSCANCQGRHFIAQCQRFLNLPSQDKAKLLQQQNLCFNCLSKGHRVQACLSRFRCRECGKRHHTLIHGSNSPPPQKKEHTKSDINNSSFTGFGSSLPPSCNSMVLLGTLCLLVKGPRGDYHSARAVLDSGSQHTFISASLARRIGAEMKPFGGSINSLGESAIPSSTLKGVTTCTLHPHSKDKKLKASPIVVDTITSPLPSRELPRTVVQSLVKHSLADQHFGTPSPVDVLIGGDLYFHIISGAPYPTEVDDLFFCPTIFGLVVSGVLQQSSPATSTLSFFLDSRPSIETQLKAFWELEEPAPIDRRHPDDVHVEEHFRKTHSRTTEGRYVVRLPFKTERPDIGNNREVALRRLYALESKFRRDSSLSEHYQNFMQEYLDLGHMCPAATQSSYIIPHHGVWQDRPQGRKLRVVFDASCPSSSRSLNEALYAGPKLQEDICTVLIRFRLYAIAICSDLVKMYRQILIHPYDRCHQHIFWRNDPSSSVEEEELKTVTYGITSSAFHALRVVRQLVQDEGEQFPLAAKRIPDDMYVDDIVSGADSVDEATQLIDQLTCLFAKGGFSLSKWASSMPQLLPFSSTSNSTYVVSLSSPEDDCVKILGLFWNPAADAFSYTTRPPPSKPITKRAMLSSVARIFDPLGLLAPVIFSAKALIQEVWKKNLDWDDTLPDDLTVSWDNLTSNWAVLSTISIPRYITVPQASLQLVGFCDAFSKGYAAALYLRAEPLSGDVKVSLIKAKSKVAPLKFHSIARLELCGALLLSHLVKSVTLPTSGPTVCFTDSEVVLSWLRTPSHDLKVFEANRVSQILSVVTLDFWRHVSSEENPADVASRGCTPDKLKSENLWWNGPSWLKQDIDCWYQPSQHAAVLAVVSPPQASKPLDDWTSRFSSYATLVRTTARMLRFIHNSRSKANGSNDFVEGPISASEFHAAELRCASFVQKFYLPGQLFTAEPTTPKELAQLQPFRDERGIIRVGGRLQLSQLSPAAKHPILLPHGAHFTKLVVDHIHQTNFHAGATLCLSLLRSKFWVPRATRLIRGQILRCVHCRLLKAKPVPPVMAPLPKERFEQGRAFVQVGVDYAGPFLIKESRRRNAALGKAYLALFVCFASKAVHLELVTSLSTPAFLAALDRFIARRGAPSVIWSDNGTNFLGTSKFIRALFKLQREDHTLIQNHLSPTGIEWRFIPPRAPHFGGLWEAGVKSAKSLLTGTVGKQPYTFEELTTILHKIESLLNSRPLCPITEDVENFEFLTPGHFLIGAPLSSLPAPQEPPSKSSYFITRWKLLQMQISHVWSRWSKEYLHHLQERSKWTKSAPNLKIGDLVILLEKRYNAVGQWPVARITNTFPGRDGVTRTVTVRTPSGTNLTRAVTSLAPLFPADEE